MSPLQFADQLRVVCDVDDHSVSIWEERPPWRGPGEWTRMGIAKFRYIHSRATWTLYWMRADLKWHLFEPVAQTKDLSALVKVVDENRYGAFFG